MPDDTAPLGADLLLETHRTVKVIERALLGDLSSGTPGLLETTRDHGRRLTSLESLLASLQEGKRWAWRTVAGYAMTSGLGAALALLVSAMKEHAK